MQLSAADYGWPALGHDAVFTVVSDLGFQGVDIGVFGDATHITMNAVADRPEETAQVVGDRAARHHLTVADVFITPSLDLNRLSPTAADPEEQEAGINLLKACCRFARDLGVSGITMLPGNPRLGDTPDDALTAAAEGLRPRVDVASQYELELSVEPHTGSCIATPEATASLLEAVPGLRITLDPAHFVYQGFQFDSWQHLIDASRHIQLRPSRAGVMQARVPDDDLGLPRVVRACESRGYSGWLASEFVWIETWDCDRVDNTSESARLRALVLDAMT